MPLGRFPGRGAAAVFSQGEGAAGRGRQKRGSLQGVYARRLHRARSPAPGRRGRGWRWGLCAVVSALLALPAAADSNPYAEYSDEQLTRVAADWEALGSEERRDFFLEMRRRMAEHGRGQAIPVEVRRRFGRTVRGPDGSVVHIEQVVRIRSRPAEEASSAEGPDDYGKGFERRVEEAEDTVRAPVVMVKKTVKGD